LSSPLTENGLQGTAGAAAEQLLALMERVARATTADEVYAAAMDCLQHALGVDRSAVLLFDDAGVMRFVASRGLSVGYCERVEGHSPWAPDTVDAAPVLVANVRDDASLAAFQAVFEGEDIAALTFIPLRFADKLLGKFMLYFRRPYAPSAPELSLAQAIAGHVAFALDRFREAAARRRHEEAQALLAEAAVSLAASLDYRQTLDTLTHLLVPTLADWCVVHVVGPSGEILPGELAHADPTREAAVRAMQHRWHFSKDATVGIPQVIRSREPLLVPRVALDSLRLVAQDPEHQRAMEALGPRSCMLVPLIARKRTLGTITLVAAESGRVFGPDDLALAQELASRAALAIDNARLFAEVEEARNKAEESARRLRIMAEQSSAMAGALDHETALRQLASFLVRHVADYCITYSLEPGNVVRRVGLAHREPAKVAPLLDALREANPPSLDDGWGVGAVLRTGEPLFVPNLPEGLIARTLEDEVQRRVITELRPVSCIVVPIRARGRIQGAIAVSLAGDTERRYTTDDLALLEELAGRAGLVADNARLFQAAQAAVRARDEVVAVVSHDIRSPLQTIMTACSVLDLDVPEPRKAQSRAMIRRAVSQMERLTTDLLDISRIEAGGIQLRCAEVDAAALLVEAAAAFQPTADQRHIRLEVTSAPDLPRLWADRDRLMQVLSNLLANAFKFTPEGGCVTLVAAHSPTGVRLQISDTGCGIPPDHVPRLFDRFWQADRKRGPGAGLGLAIVKGLVEEHGGKIEVRSAVGQGSTFEVTLPARVKPPAAAQ
jgi:signal transduction histidine kinase